MTTETSTDPRHVITLPNNFRSTPACPRIYEHSENMITLYHCVSARSFRPLWMLEEMGLAYHLYMLPFPPRVHAKPFFDINPLGTVPALLDEDLQMTESAAICQYLADRYGPTPLAVRLGEPDYGLFLDLLHFGEATLTFPQTLVLRYGRFEPEERRLPQVVEDYSRWFLGRLRRIDALLQDQREYLCAGRFTAADISVGYALMLAEYQGLAAQFTEQTLRYWQRLQARQAFQCAIARQHNDALAQAVPTTPAPCI